jgi:hypothetical protein
MPPKMVKKWRIDEHVHRQTGDKVGIYVEAGSGTFYAYVPETEDGGKFLSAATKPELMKLVRVEAEHAFSLVWEKKIVVQLDPPTRGSRNRHGGSWSDTTWDPTKPETAGDSIRLYFERYEAAVDARGERVEREWEEREWEERDRRGLTRTKFRPSPGIRVELDFTEEKWEALTAFQTQITQLLHNLRTFIASEDLPLLLQSAGNRLLLGMIDPTPKAQALLTDGEHDA